MSEREQQLDREFGDVGVDLDGIEGFEESGASSPDRTSGSLRGRVATRATSIFGPKRFVLATVASLVGLLVVGGLLPFGIVGQLVGVAFGAFLYGTVASSSRYVETAVAGGLLGGVFAVLGNLAFTLFGVGLPIIAVGAAGGVLAGLAGHYFGRDLRAGLTRDL